MNYYELKKLATPGPLTVEREAVLRGRDGTVVGAINRMSVNRSSDRNCADLRLLVHCINNFDKALETLKTFANIEIAAAEMAVYGEHFCNAVLATRKLVAELEDVK